MTGDRPSFFVFLACFLKDIQQRLVFFTAIGAHVQVFADQWHQLRRIFFVYFPFHVFVDPGIDLIAGCIFLSYTFEHAQKSQDGLVGQFLLMMKAVPDLLDNGSDFHKLCVLMSDRLVILLMLKKCKDFMRSDILHRETPFESQASVVEEFI